MKKINWKDVAMRAAKTFVQAFIATASLDQLAGITDAESAKRILTAVFIPAAAAGVSAVWNMAAEFFKNREKEMW